MSIQLEALADEVFGAAAAQGRAGGVHLRRPFGEIVWNTTYPTAIVQAGDRYVFAFQPVITVTSGDLAKTSGQDVTTWEVSIRGNPVHLVVP